MGRKIAIVSGKGGVGKSTVACGLGIALARRGLSVCLVDLDMGLNNLDVYLGLENKVIYDLSDVLANRCRLKQSLLGVKMVDNLYLLPSSRYDGEAFDQSEISRITDKLAQVFDYVLLDAPAGLNIGFEMAVSGCREALVVVTPHVSSLRDADKVISRLRGAMVERIFVVVNRIRGDMVARGEMLKHGQIERLLKTPLLGVVPESDNINIYSSYKFERIAKDKDILAFNILASNLKNDKKVIYDYESRYRGILGAIRRSIKRGM